MASIQAPSTFIPSKICSPAQDEEQMVVDAVTLITDDIMPEPTTEILTTGSNINVAEHECSIVFYHKMSS